jgi:hypothetical protein
VVFFPNKQQAQAELDRLKHMWETLQRAKTLVDSEEASAELKRTLKDVYWMERVLVKRVAGKVASEDWRVCSQVVRTEIWELYNGVADTLCVCERPFNTLQDAKRANKNKRLNEYRIQAISASDVGTLKNSGANILELSQEHWELDFGELHQGNHLKGGKVFVVEKKDKHLTAFMDKKLNELVSTKPSERYWQPAGPDAARRMITATSLLVSDANTEWRNVGKAWRSKIFMTEYIFVNTTDDTVWLSLGNNEHGFLGVHLLSVRLLGS